MTCPLRIKIRLQKLIIRYSFIIIMIMMIMMQNSDLNPETDHHRDPSTLTRNIGNPANSNHSDSSVGLLTQNFGKDHPTETDHHGGPAATMKEDSPKADVDEVAAAAAGGGRSRGKRSGTSVSTLLAVAATVGVTFVIVVVILTVIVRLLRTQKQSPPPGKTPSPPPLGKTLPSQSYTGADRGQTSSFYAKSGAAIRHYQRSGTLYFLPAAAASSLSNGGCLSAPTSRTRLDLTLTSADGCGGGGGGAKSVGEITTLIQAPTAGQSAVNGRELLNGRGTNAEPLRMYKWEDF